MKACSSKLRAKVICHKSYKKLYKSDFLCNEYNQNNNFLTNKFSGIVNKHTVFKHAKFVRGNKPKKKIYEK